jgi:hypothetical protein
MTNDFCFYDALGTGSATTHNLEKVQDFVEKFAGSSETKMIGSRIKF